MKKILIALAIFLQASALLAQNNQPSSRAQSKEEKRDAKRERINALLRQEEEGEIVFFKQSIFGIKLATDGYGLSYELGRMKSQRLANLYWLELSEKKHNKEKKQGASVNQYQINSVIPGKLNNFYQLKLGYGQQRTIGGKGNKNGAAVSAIYGAGLSLGLLKPYYVDVREGRRVIYDKVIDSAYVPLGASGFTVGWGEMKFRPGAVAKAALRFDYGRLNETVSAIEAGVQAEFFAQKVPQMLYNKERQFFFSAYLQLLLGRRR
ncbi:MAG: hypothetical protein ACXWV5_05925 [Flavitalea sp.]